MICMLICSTHIAHTDRDQDRSPPDIFSEEEDMQLEDLFREDSEEESDGGTVSSTRDSINRHEVRHNEQNRDGNMPGPSRRQEGRQPNGYGNEPSGPPDGVDRQPEPEQRRERKAHRNRKRYRPYRHVTVSEIYGECQYI